MTSTFNIPQESKIWIYLSPRAFTPDEISIIEIQLQQFLTSWESHGSAISGYFKIIENQFILIAADESAQIATGCSIDKSVAVIKKIETLLQLNLTDKGLIGFRKGDHIETVGFQNIKTAIENGDLTPETVFYNNSITTAAELSSSWKIAAKDSWLKRYFK